MIIKVNKFKGPVEKIECGRFGTPSIGWRTWSGIYYPTLMTKQWWTRFVHSYLGGTRIWTLLSTSQYQEAGLSEIQHSINPVFFYIYIWDIIILRDSQAHLTWGMKGYVMLLFTRRRVPPSSTTSYYGHSWIAENWFPNFPALKEPKKVFSMTWTANGCSPPDIGCRRSWKPIWSFTKGSTKGITLYSNPNIIGWI